MSDPALGTCPICGGGGIVRGAPGVSAICEACVTRPGRPALPLPSAPEGGPAAECWGHFELVRLLGRGGMGEVYEANDRLLDRRVAIKVLSGGPRQRDVGRLVEEARAAARLEHPNVVTVYQVGEHRGSHFIAMQLVPGVSAGARVREQGAMAPDEAARVIRDAARGLAAAHELGLVHRDVKPDNILLGEKGVVKVADFGLARQYGAATHGAAPEPIAGTPNFTSPEQAQGRLIDHRSDIYSLGATWYYLLTGRAPFEGGSVTEILQGQVSAPAPPLAASRSDVPADHAALIDWMMAKDPARRPQSAGEVIEAVGRLLPDHGAQSASAGEVKASRSRSAVSYVAVAALVIAGIGGALLGNQLWSFQAAGGDAPDEAVPAAPTPNSDPAPRPTKALPEAENRPKSEAAPSPPNAPAPKPSGPPIPVKAPPFPAPPEDYPPPRPGPGPPHFPPEPGGGIPGAGSPPLGPGEPPPPPPPRGGRGRL